MYTYLQYGSRQKIVSATVCSVAASGSQCPQFLAPGHKNTQDHSFTAAAGTECLIQR